MGVSKDNAFYEYLHDDGTHTAIMGPKDVDANTDWQASTFGISTQCFAFRNTSCDFGEPEEVDIYSPAVPFNCSKERGAEDVSGKLYAVFHQMNYKDGWHKFLREGPLFESTLKKAVFNETMRRDASNLTDEDGMHVFANPWQWRSAVNMFDTDKLMNTSDTSLATYQGPQSGTPMQMLSCNSTGKTSNPPPLLPPLFNHQDPNPVF